MSSKKKTLQRTFRRPQLNTVLFKHEIASFLSFWETTLPYLDPDPLTH
jgi:hypothetical protein